MDVVTIAAFVAAGLGMGLGAIGSAIGEGYGAGLTLEGMARQPKYRDALVRDMLIGQAISETPGIFALVISIILLFAVESTGSWAHAAAVMGAGLCIGLGAVGPAWGSGLIAGRANSAASRNPARGGATIRMMLIAQAFCQTTVVFALVVSLVLWARGGSFAQGDLKEQIVRAAAVLGAGLCMGFGALGPAVGTGDAGAAASEATALHPESGTEVMKAFFVGAAVSQTTGVYALVIALVLIFVV